MPYEWLDNEQKCYVSLVVNLNLEEVGCIKHSLSKAIGVGIVIGGSIMKFPQLVLSTLRSLVPYPAYLSLSP
jgi:mannose-P-dolichol utilization defect protein 1